jgi:hypothetical protein
MLNDYVKPDQGFVACPNQDVVYGTGFYSLDEEPVVIQVPDEAFSLYIRAYWGKKAILDGTWIPPKIEQVR